MKRIDYLLVSNETQSDELVDISAKLVELFDKSPEEAQKLLALIDGVESFESFDKPEEIPLDVLEQLIPSIGEEAFSDRIKSLWSAIVSFIRRLFDRLSSDSLELKPTLAGLRWSAENVRIKARGARLDASRQPLVINRHIPSMCVLYRPPRDMGTINAGLKVLINVLTQYFAYVDQQLLSGLGQVQRTVSNMDPLKLDNETLQREIIKPLQALLPTTLMGKLGATPDKASGLIVGPQLLGNIKLTARVGDSNTLRGIAEHRLMLAFALPSPKELPASITIPHFTLTTTDQVVRNVLTLCDLINTSLDHAASRRQQAESIISSFDRFVNAVYTIPSGNPIVKENAEALIRVSKSLSDWLSDPYRGLVGAAIRAMRSAVYVCQLNNEN